MALGFETIGNFFSLTPTPETSSVELGLNGLVDVAETKETIGVAPELSLSDTVYQAISKLQLDLPTTTPTGIDNPAITSAKDTTQGFNNLNELIAQGMAKARHDKAIGNTLSTIAAAGDVFNSVMNWGTDRHITKLQYQNTELQINNQIQAIDNQVAYTKARMTEKLNQTIAQNIVTTAAKNIKVQSGEILEQSKAEARQMNETSEMLDSNARLQKIGLENEKKQAKIQRDLAYKQQWANLGQGFMKLGASSAKLYGNM